MHRLRVRLCAMVVKQSEARRQDGWGGMVGLGVIGAFLLFSQPQPHVCRPQ